MTIPAGSIGAREKLRAKVVAAVDADIQRVGPGGFKGATLARKFAGKVASASTIARWIKAATPAAVGRLEQDIKMAALDRAERAPDPAADAAREVGARLPAVLTTADVAGAGGAVEFVAKLQECVRAAEQTMAHARTDAGAPRNIRALLAGSEHLRRSLETAVKMREAMREDRDLDAMMRAVVAEIALESPLCAERIFRRIEGVLTSYGA